MGQITNIIDAVAAPVVIVKDGEVFATSRDVAAFFGKEHRHVLRDIDNLIKEQPELAEGGLPNFGHTPYVEESNGQTYRMYTMTRTGFTLLAMGFTGPKALKWKLRYIEAFDAMERALREPLAVPDLSDPAVLIQLLTEHASKRIEAEQRAVAAESVAASMKEDVDAHHRLVKAEGSLNITEAAKNLSMRPRDLFDWLAHNGWIYRRMNGSAWLGYQTKCNQGLLEHKSTTVLRADGTEKITEQVRITAKGMSALARVIRPDVKPVE